MRFLRKIKHNGRSLFWGLFGRFLVNPPFPEKPQSFLFICKGNVCRSPFAEYLAKKKASNGSWKSAEFSSAGLKVSVKNPPPSEAIDAAQRFGVLLEDHRSKQLTREMIVENDVLLAMEAGQFRELRRLYPQFRNKVFLLPLYAQKEGETLDYWSRYNIQDPYGGGIEEFISCFQRIEDSINSMFAENFRERTPSLQK